MVVISGVRGEIVDMVLSCMCTGVDVQRGEYWKNDDREGSRSVGSMTLPQRGILERFRPRIVETKKISYQERVEVYNMKGKQ